MIVQTLVSFRIDLEIPDNIPVNEIEDYTKEVLSEMSYDFNLSVMVDDYINIYDTEVVEIELTNNVIDNL